MKDPKFIFRRIFVLSLLSFLIACTPTKKLSYVINSGPEVGKN
jgi:hypothetical protein